jgi:hypothetical protein
MNSSLRTSRFLAALVAALAFGGLAAAQTDPAAESTYIVQSDSLELARSHVRRVGAEPARDFDIIHAVEARLTEAQVAKLRANSNVRVFDDRSVRTRGTSPGGSQD